MHSLVRESTNSRPGICLIGLTCKRGQRLLSSPSQLVKPLSTSLLETTLCAPSPCVGHCSSKHAARHSVQTAWHGQASCDDDDEYNKRPYGPSTLGGSCSVRPWGAMQDPIGPYATANQGAVAYRSTVFPFFLFLVHCQSLHSVYSLRGLRLHSRR